MAGFVLGIDPGSQKTGFGVIQLSSQKMIYVCSGCIRPKGKDVGQRLCELHEHLHTILKTYQPELIGMEEVFMGSNSKSALTLGSYASTHVQATVHHVFSYSFVAAATKRGRWGVGENNITAV